MTTCEHCNQRFEGHDWAGRYLDHLLHVHRLDWNEAHQTTYLAIYPEERDRAPVWGANHSDGADDRHLAGLLLGAT